MFRRTVSVVVLAFLLTGMLVLAFNIRPVRASGTIYIRADGSIEPSDAPISTFDNVTYTLTGNVASDTDGIFVERDNIVVDGSGFAVEGTGGYAPDGNYSMGILLYGRSNVTIRNTKVENFWHGIVLDSSSNNNIGGNTLTNNGYGGIWLHVSSNYNNINGNTFTDDGLNVWGSYSNTVENNTVNGRPLVYLEGVADYSVGDAGQVVLVRCDRIRVEDLTLFRTSACVQLWETNNSTIHGNNIGDSWYGIWLASSSSNSISANIIANNNGDGIHLDSSSNNSIDGNNITNSYNGVWLGSSSNANSISANTITGSGGYGILFYESSNYNSMDGNTIADNRVGIDLMYSFNNTVRGNTLIDSGLGVQYSYSNSIENNTVNGRPLVYLEGVADYSVGDAGQVVLVRCDRIRVEDLSLSRTSTGVDLWETNNSTISRNTITSSEAGILLYSSSGNTISANTLTNNGRYGIFLNSSSNYNSINENTITNSGTYGISLHESSNNHICHNNLDNALQAETTAGFVNVWDDGYPSGGNYWSDYTGVDVKSGPNQDQPGSDGIGDTPYTIDGNNMDHYPLMGAGGSTPPIRVPEDYGSIQAAIDAAIPWTTILIGPGVYNESIVVNKPLTIIGRLGSEPVFKGGGSGIAITLLSGASGTVIAGIVITNWDQGILINNASDCKIYNNIMSLMGIKGIVLEGVNAVNNRVYNNIFEQDLVAVNVASSSQSNDVSRNIICLSTTAIKIETSGNTICANIMSTNQVGINITNSSGNVIYHNNFVNNTVQVSISDSTGNTWDDGYPSGGNYWSDYTGVDLKSGPNQDQAGSDGIVDAAYTVAVGGIDRYPLARPFNAHDVGITDYAISKTVVGKGYTLSLEVKILNCGVYDENFPVTAYANASTVAAQAVALTRSNSIILTLTWNTFGFDCGNYTVNVHAEPVLNETNTADNVLCCGTVYVGIPGDVNGNGAVDIYDAIVVSNSFMSAPGSRKWNANANINNDNMVDIYDAILLANNYGKTV